MADISDGSPAIESATMESEAGETFLLRCKAKLPRDVPYKFCLHDNFFSKRFQSFQFSVRCQPCRRKADKGASHQPQKIDKTVAKMFISLIYL